MELYFAIYSAVAAAASACLCLALLRRRLRARRRSSYEALGEKYLHIVIHALMSDGGKVPHFPVLRHAGARILLAETIAGLVSATYGLDTRPLRKIVENTELESTLIRRIRRSRGYRRAWYLSLLGRLPVTEAAVRTACRYMRSRNRYVRFYALLVQLAHEPTTSLRAIAEYPYPFSAFEVSEIMTMLRRGLLPIAYEPLIESPVRNLRVVGLGIVRQFGIEEAERQLLHIAAHDEAEELGREAIYTLCAMRRPLARRDLIQRIRSMSSPDRKALLRYMALEGYSQQALHGLFDDDERPYYESLILSYKSCLVCS